MSAFAEDQDRRLIPRWRFADQVGASSEFAGDPRGKRRPLLDRSFLEEKLAVWQDKREFGAAIDLVGCGIGGGWLGRGSWSCRILGEKRTEIVSPS